jgi:hypothetical protein
MTEKPLSLSKMAWGQVHQELGKIWPTGLNVFLITIGVLAVALWQPLSLYFTIPLVFLSFFFAYQLSISYVHKGEEMGNRQFLSFYSAYFRMPFLGSYRVIRSALLSFLYSIAFGLLVAFLYYAIAINVSSAFKTDWSNLLSYASNNQVDATNSLLSSSPSLLLFEQTIALAEGIAIFFAFFFYVAFYGLSPHLRSIIMGASPRISNAIFVGGIRKARGFWRDYFKSLWPLLVAEIVGFALGFLIAYYLSKDYTYWLMGGVSGALLFLTPLFPYYFEVAGLLMDKYRRAFSDYSISLAQKTLERLEETKQMSEEEAQEMKKTIDQAKKMEEENPPLPPLDESADPRDDDDDSNDDNDQ